MQPRVQLPTISLITPSYNQGAFIESAIQSVLAQNYPCLEYIVMDGGSTDDTLRILESHQHELIFISERDRGQVHAINKALSIASGEIVAFLNSDDLYEPGALWLVGAHFSAHPGCGWLTGRCPIVDRDGRPVRPAVTTYKNFWLRLKSPAVLYILNYISQPATFWRRDLMHAAGYLDETLACAFDYDYWLRLARLCPPTFIDADLARFRVHPASKSNTAGHVRFSEQLQVARRYTASPLLLSLHSLHNRLTTRIYSSPLIAEACPQGRL